MGRFLRKPISRRQFLGAAAGSVLAGAGALRGQPASASHPGGPVRVLVHDAVHDAAALSRARPSGARTSTVGQDSLRRVGLFLSPPITSPFPFTHVGLHWKGKGPDLESARFEVRTSTDGASWSAWQRAYVEALPDETPAGETYAALVAAPRHLYLQYRVRLPELVSLTAITATFINSVDGPVIESAGGAAPAAGDRPINLTREDWGADESLRFASGRERWPRRYVPVKKLIVHHTATTNDYTDGAAQVRAIYTYHARTLGWGDIGYNALVDRFGKSYEGRYGREDADYGGDYGPRRREVFSQDIVAGHTLRHNYGSCGIALIGNFEVAELPPDRRMIGRLLEILEWESRLRRIGPHGASDYLLHEGSWNRGLANVCGHRDCSATACPGRFVYQELPAIREALAERLTQPDGPAVVLGSGPNGVTETFGDLSYQWHDPLGRAVAYSYYLEGWSLALPRHHISYLAGFTDDRRPAWSDWTQETSATFAPPSSGHYTFHVRSRDANGRICAYEDNRTILGRREEMATEQELRSIQAAASIFVTIAAHVLNGQPLPASLKDQARFLLVESSEATTGETAAQIRS